MPTGRPQLLLVVAAPIEYGAVVRGVVGESAPIPDSIPYWTPIRLDPAIEIVLSGVGKANAAGATARALDSMRHAAVLSLGIAGALPKDPVLALCSVVAASACAFADEGLASPEGFTDLSAMGFPIGDFSGPSVPVDLQVRQLLRSLADVEGVVATVSTCSGTDALAAEVVRRTGAAAEGMEGAAVALVAHRLGVPMGELRVISNTTGDRSRQVWEMKPALARLADVAGRVVRADWRGSSV